MAILFMDGFDHYGSTGAMQQGTYQASNGVTLQSSGARTGTNYITINGNVLIYSLPGTLRSKVGVGVATFFSSLRSSEDPIIQFYSSSPNGIVARISLTQDGRLHTGIRNHPSVSNFTEVAVTTEPVIFSSAWQHLEVYCDIVNGNFEIRVDGVVVTTVENSSIVEINDINRVGLSWGGFDDFYVWDTSGDTNNDFIGDKKVFYLKPATDVSPQDWSVTGAATGAAAIGTDAPNDATYIKAAPTGLPLVSKFEFDTLDPQIASIAAIMTTVRQRKDDAGTANTQISLESNGQTDDGADRPITTQFTYWQDVFELDPDTGAPWTPQGLQAAKLVIARTA